MVQRSTRGTMRNLLSHLTSKRRRAASSTQFRNDRKEEIPWEEELGINFDLMKFDRRTIRRFDQWGGCHSMLKDRKLI